MKVGIIGAGTMGAGIAQGFARTQKYEVLLCDLNRELAEKGRNKIADTLRHREEKGKISNREVCETMKIIPREPLRTAVIVVWSLKQLLRIWE